MLATKRALSEQAHAARMARHNFVARAAPRRHHSEALLSLKAQATEAGTRGWYDAAVVAQRRADRCAPCCLPPWRRTEAAFCPNRVHCAVLCGSARYRCRDMRAPPFGSVRLCSFFDCVLMFA